jgi:2-polyprenyl-3-methyl-5-hydroxy-6-metoxy-1,4-benzoquinol methylase
MGDTLSSGPAPIPLPDRSQIERLTSLYELAPADATGGLRGWLAFKIRTFIARALFRQQEFNAALVDHLNRDIVHAIEAHHASRDIIEWVGSVVDEMKMHREALQARQRRNDNAVTALASADQELRTAVGVLQQATQNFKRELAKLSEAGVSARPAAASASAIVSEPASQLDAADSHKYVGFEDQFRGERDEIRRRVAEYVPIFRAASNVVDIGCGRGEFLVLLAEQGVTAKGVDVNRAMVEVCREQRLDVVESDALAFLRAQPDSSIGGLLAAQVVEHLEPRYLTQLLDVAFDKLRPGAPIVLETINPACWFAFFESYIRDLTHVRPIHPDTLKYLLVATGFQQVDIRYRAPYPQNEKLQAVAGAVEEAAPLADWADTLNANAEKLNRLLFTFLDYAAIGLRP